MTPSGALVFAGTIAFSRLGGSNETTRIHHSAKRCHGCLPIPAGAQDTARVIGVLAGTAETDPQAQRRVLAFTQALKELGWIEGKNIKLEKRYSAGNPERLQGFASDLVQLKCAMIVAEAAQAVNCVMK